MSSASRGFLQMLRSVALLQTRLLRSALEWGAEMLGRDDDRAYGGADAVAESNESVKIMMWPPGEFKRLPRGTTAGSCFRTYVRAPDPPVRPRRWLRANRKSIHAGHGGRGRAHSTFICRTGGCAQLVDAACPQAQCCPHPC